MSTHRSSLQSLQTGHIGINISDLSRSVKFYEDVFDFEVLRMVEDESRRFAFLGKGEITILTLWQQSSGRFQKGAPGLHHLSFRVETVEEVRQLEKRLREMDVKLLYEGIVPHSEGGESGGLFFEDPDGIRLEVFSPSGLGGQSAPVPGAPSCGFF